MSRRVRTVLDNLCSQHPASAKVCTLLDKPLRRIEAVPIDYRGFEVDDHFVVGYGMDWQQRYRSLSHIGIVDPTVPTA